MDGKELKKLKEQIEGIEKSSELFLESCVKELAGRLLAMVIEETKPGIYPPNTGKTGGTLKRGWTTEKMTKSGKDYTVNVINPVEYAPYVEYGHRKSNHKGWVEGKFIMTRSAKKIQSKADAIIQKRLEAFLNNSGG